MSVHRDCTDHHASIAYGDYGLSNDYNYIPKGSSVRVLIDITFGKLLYGG